MCIPLKAEWARQPVDRCAAAPRGILWEREEPGRAANVRSNRLSSRPWYESASSSFQFILGRCGIYQDASCGILRAMGFAAWPPYGISLAGTENGAQKQKSTRFFVCLFVLSSVF
jgi:hypothetical protein